MAFRSLNGFIDSLIAVSKRMERQWLAPQYLALRYQGEKFPSLSRIPQSILVFKPDDIGDAVLALPAIAALKRQFPKAKLYLLCQKKTEPLYVRSGLFDEVVSVGVTVRALRFQSFNLKAAMARFSVQRFDVAIFLRTYPAFFKTFLKVNADVHVHPRDPRMKSKSPYQSKVSLWDDVRPSMERQLLEIVSPLISEGDNIGEFPKFQWTEEDRIEVEGEVGAPLPEKFGVIHPFNRIETKRFPDEEWILLMARLKKELPQKWFVIGGPEDVNPILDGLGASLAGKLSLEGTGYLMSRASVFIGNESGPGHWAAAMGIPTITLMGGHSHPNEWSPVGKSLVLRHDVECSPCHRRVCPKIRRFCLEEMKASDLVGPILDFLKSPETNRGVVNVGSERPSSKPQHSRQMSFENAPG